MAESATSSRHEFRAEVRQLLDILVHSLYTNKEIFLRELISNASDALDKLRFERHRAGDPVEEDLEIRIRVDKDKKLITIQDNGIGMSEAEVIANLGTIAHSGTADMLRAAAENKQGVENLIGRFGVGFYSVFMVAQEVVVRTQSYRPEDPQVVWRSDGLGTYEIEPGELGAKRGTTVEIYLRDDSAEYADEYRLRSIIKKHSNFVSFPIYLDKERINTVPALWREPKFQVKKEQYSEFYKFVSYDNEEPFETLHLAVDAPVQFHALLFIPKKSLDFMGVQREAPGVDIYARRVLIQHGNTDLLPEYLGFVRGVVDSEDLPLNISRETFQENLVFSKIGSSLTKQVLSQLGKIADKDKDRYIEFWNQHGRVFKLGYTDFLNREEFASLLRFNSSAADKVEELVSLDEYISRAREGQKEIYYLGGASRAALEASPHLELLRRKGLEVLFLYEPIDEFVLEGLGQYKDFQFVSGERTDSKKLEQFESAEQRIQATPLTDDETKDFDRLLDRMKLLLGDRVMNVVPSQRLVDSACVLISPEGAMTSSMERLYKLANRDKSVPKKVLEVNRDHGLVRNLLALFRRDPKDDFLAMTVEQMFEGALLLDGYLEDPHQMVQRVQEMMERSTGWYLGREKNDPDAANESPSEATSSELSQDEAAGPVA